MVENGNFQRVRHSLFRHTCHIVIIRKEISGIFAGWCRVALLCRIFKDALGMRPMEYVNQVRIEMAKSLLLYSDLSVREIGQKCGFQNTNYFNKIFKKFEHLTPLEYRNSVL